VLNSLTPRQQTSTAQHYRELLYVLVKRNLNLRYRGSFLGAYWSLMNPLIMTGVYSALFSEVFAKNYGSPIIYAFAAFMGLVVVNFFAASTTQALESVVKSGQLLNKIKLPVSVFPVSMIASNVFQFIVGPLPLLAVITLLLSKQPLNLLILPFPLLAMVMFSAGIGLLASALYVFFRDLPYFYELIVYVTWLSSPVFYPANIAVHPIIRFLLELNPLYYIIESLRGVVGIPITAGIPEFQLIWRALLSGFIVLGISWACFQAWRSKFMDLL